MKPTLPVNSSNRSEARKYLTWMGLPGAVVRSLTIAELNHYCDDVVALGNRIQLETGKAPDFENLDAPAIPEQPEVVKPAEGFKVIPAASTHATPANVSPDQLAALSTLLGSLMPAQQVDEARIVELIKQHAAAPTKIEITKDGETRIVEGAHHKLTPMLIKVLSTHIGDRRPNAWLAGPAGSGKTTAAIQVAEALDLPFYSTGAVQTEYKLTGFVNAEGQPVRTPFREAFEHGGVFLWDEVDGSHPNALVAFNQALANGSFAFPDAMVDKHPDFIAIAAANTFGQGATVEYVGRNRIDAATLDRFVFIEWDYDEELEKQIAGNDGWVEVVLAYRRAVAALSMRHIVSPRASIDGAALLAAGVDPKQVRELVVRKGLDADSWNKLERKSMEV